MKAQSPIAKTGLALTLAATLGVVAAPVAASAQSYGRPADTPTTCSAPGGKQEGGALIGALIGGLLGSKVSKNERTAGAVIGAGLGAAAGGYIGCKAQANDARSPYADGYGYGYGRESTYVRDGYRLASYVQPTRFQRAGGRFIATTTVNLRAAPDTRSNVVGRLNRGETFEALAYAQRGNWVLVSQRGVGIGYVAADYVRPTGYSRANW